MSNQQSLHLPDIPVWFLVVESAATYPANSYTMGRVLRVLKISLRDIEAAWREHVTPLSAMGMAVRGVTFLRDAPDIEEMEGTDER